MTINSIKNKTKNKTILKNLLIRPTKTFLEVQNQIKITIQKNPIIQINITNVKLMEQTLMNIQRNHGNESEETNKSKTELNYK